VPISVVPPLRQGQTLDSPGVIYWQVHEFSAVLAESQSHWAARRLRYQGESATEPVARRTEALQMETSMIICQGMSTPQLSLRHAHIAGGSTLIGPIPLCLHLQSPHKAWLLGLILFAGLSGCGPAASDPEQNHESRASLEAPPESTPASQHSPASHNNQASPAAIEEPLSQPDTLVLPIWIAQALDAPDVSVRLKALDKWAKLGTDASLDPLVVALDDEDDDVRRKAMDIIEQHWAVEQEDEPETETNGDKGAEMR